MAKKKRTRKEPAFADIDAWIKTQSETRKHKLRRLLKELKQLVKRPEREDFVWWHRVGIRALEFFPKIDRHYGVSVVELLADYVQPGRERTDKTVTNSLYRARQLADTFTLQEIRSLGKKRTASGKPLGLNHVTSLLAVEDKDERSDLLKKCLEGNWGLTRLRQEIQSRAGRKRTGGGMSPTPLENPSPGVALRDISVMARRWMAYHHVWFVGAKPALKRIPVKERDEAMLEELDRAAHGLEELRDAVDQGMERIEDLTLEVKEAIELHSRKRGGRSGQPARRAASAKQPAKRKS
jgi:hypothetical protein